MGERNARLTSIGVIALNRTRSTSTSFTDLIIVHASKPISSPSVSKSVAIVTLSASLAACLRPATIVLWVGTVTMSARIKS